MRPNLLYIFADQWRYQAVGTHQQDQVKTPCMDQFAEESACFTNAYSVFPLCSPHRGSLMTGKYPLELGLWTNCKIGLEEKVMLKPQEYCFGNVLKENGYQTGYIGKWHLDASELNFSPKPKSGAMRWDAYTPPGERRQGLDYWLSYGAGSEHMDPHYWADSDEQIRPGKWSAEFETDKALEYLEDKKGDDNPFALFVSYNPPHPPFDQVPDRYYEQYQDMDVTFRSNVPEEMRTELMKTQIRQYYAAVTGVDEQFGRIMDYLRENGLEENTLVILSADHGELLGSHGQVGKNIWYDESIHIPLMMRQKGTLVHGEDSAMFASVDHMPTILGLMDLPIPAVSKGYSHAKMIGRPDKEAPEELFVCSMPGAAKEEVEEFEKLGINHKCFGWRGLKGQNYTYVVVNGHHPGYKQQEYLYHDDKDPYQLNPEEIEADCRDSAILELRRKLDGYLKLTGDPFLWQRRAI